MRLTKIYVALAAIGLIVSPPTPAFAIYCTNCATIWQAYMASLSQAKDYVESLQQTYNSFKSLEYQLKNLQRINSMEWGSIDSQLRSLSRIASMGESLSYSAADINKRWNSLFVGVPGYEQQSAQAINSMETYKARGNALRDTSKSALNLANELHKQQSVDVATTKRIQAHSAGATGALQATQANSELLVQVIQQIQKLQTLLQADIQMTATYIAAQSDHIEAQRAASDVLHRNSPNVDETDGVDWSGEWGSSHW